VAESTASLREGGEGVGWGGEFTRAGDWDGEDSVGGWLDAVCVDFVADFAGEGKEGEICVVVMVVVSRVERLGTWLSDLGVAAGGNIVAASEGLEFVVETRWNCGEGVESGW
jgi:hypothetical protein